MLQGRKTPTPTTNQQYPSFAVSSETALVYMPKGGRSGENTFDLSNVKYLLRQFHGNLHSKPTYDKNSARLDHREGYMAIGAKRT